MNWLLTFFKRIIYLSMIESLLTLVLLSAQTVFSPNGHYQGIIEYASVIDLTTLSFTLTDTAGDTLYTKLNPEPITYYVTDDATVFATNETKLYFYLLNGRDTLLKNLNYPDLFRMVDFASTNSTEKGSIGWVTTGHLIGGELQGTRRKMLDDFSLAIKQGMMKIYDERQLKQMMGFMIIKGRAQAKANKKDDLVIAGAGAWQVQQLTPTMSFGDFDSEEFKKEKAKWRFK